jgi:cyclopropane-fatty-acyl-phospholipid synthase
MLFSSTDEKRLMAAANIFRTIGESLDSQFSIRLWDGSMIPMGKNVDPNYFVSINNPNTITSICRKPTLENVLTHFTAGNIDFHGGDLVEVAKFVRQKTNKKKVKNDLKRISKLYILKQLIPLVFGSTEQIRIADDFSAGKTSFKESERDNKDFVQFHYDVSNEFYALFLDPNMVYSCGYFRNWEDSLAQAQVDKLDMICRKLRLEPGERLLDIGCGWGALVCHAAQNFGVKALGVTLSQKQYDFATAKVKRLGLEDQVEVKLKDYIDVVGTFDKISSIGMYEHVGIANYRTYFRKISSLLKDRGILLNHSIFRRAKRGSKRKARNINPAKKMIQKYIFPGSELDNIGNTLQVMETCGLEIKDVESWRDHYALTLEHWCKRLSANEEEAIKLVGKQRYRMWLLYLGGVSMSFSDGLLLIFQTVAIRRKAKGLSGMPPTREYLYVKNE